jgi:hypothetical protein
MFGLPVMYQGVVLFEIVGHTLGGEPTSDDAPSCAGGKLIAKPRFTVDDLFTWEKTLRCCLYASTLAKTTALSQYLTTALSQYLTTASS